MTPMQASAGPRSRDGHELELAMLAGAEGNWRAQGHSLLDDGPVREFLPTGLSRGHGENIARSIPPSLIQLRMS